MKIHLLLSSVLLARAYLVAQHQPLIKSALEAYEILVDARKLAVMLFVLEKKSEIQGVVVGIARRKKLNIHHLAPTQSHFGGRTIEIIVKIEQLRKESIGTVIEGQA